MADLSKVIVTGGNGLIGSELDFGIKLSHEELDATKEESIIKACKKYSPSAILALSSVNLRDCEKDPGRAISVNVMGIYNLAKYSKLNNIPLIIISSGVVFNGDLSASFSENDAPNPQNIYGQTKYLAEILAQSVNEKSLVIRTGWLFGFLSKRNFFNNLLDAARENREITATCDQIGSPTYIKDFISVLKELITKNEKGIFHVANDGKASAVDMAQEMILKLNSKSPISRVSIADSQIKRSKSEALVSNKIKLRSWKEALKECLNS